MGKTVKMIGVFSGVLLLLTLFWGCSETSPVNTIESNRIVDNGVNDDSNVDEPKDSYDPPTLPNDGHGEDAENGISSHLYFNFENPISAVSITGIVQKDGGALLARLDGKKYTLTILPHHLTNSTVFGMDVVKGKNAFGADLFIFNFSPSGEEFFYYPILEFEDAPNNGAQKTPKFTIYYNSAGQWVTFGSTYADKNGIVSFHIPHFSTFAVLRENVQEAIEYSLD